MECLSAIKQNEIMPFAETWMDLEIVRLSEINQTEKGKGDITYMWDLKRNDRNELIYKTETDSQTSRMNLGLPVGKNGGKWYRLWDLHCSV